MQLNPGDENANANSTSRTLPGTGACAFMNGRLSTPRATFGRVKRGVVCAVYAADQIDVGTVERACGGTCHMDEATRLGSRMIGRMASAEGLQGQAFGKYLLLKRIAVGGQGEVFVANLAGAAGFNKLVVIK
jgi:hypothetical protein